jgi:hypothetical protein
MRLEDVDGETGGTDQSVRACCLLVNTHEQ